MPEMEEPEGNLNQTVDWAIDVLMRRRWIVLSAVCTISLGTIAILSYLPNRYTSEATIFAVQQRVPERYVVPTATSDVTQALEAMVQEVLSRPRLHAVIDELNLYQKQREELKPEQLIYLMRSDVTVEPIESKLGRGDVNAFKVSFVANDPKIAQAVTERLTTLFIQQNLKTRADQSATTTEFLHEQLKIARQELDQQEQRLRDFKMRHLGELPEQQQGNLGILGSVQSQLDNIMANRNQAQQQRLYLESLLSEYEQRGKRNTPSILSSDGEMLTPVQVAERDLIRLQNEKKALLAVYTSSHPDVVRKETEIGLQRTLLESLRAAKPLKPATVEGQGGVDGSSPSEQDMVVAQLRSQLRANKLESDNLLKKEQKLREDVELYQSRLNVMPVREQELTSIQRDYDLLRLHYGELLKKEQESQLAKELEKRQEGQQFQLADPPNLPTVPSSPKRLKISLIGLLGGLIIGCALAVLMELRNSSFHSEDDAIRQLSLPIVIGVPLFLTPGEEKSRSRRRAFELVAASALLSVVAAAQFYVYRHG